MLYLCLPCLPLVTAGERLESEQQPRKIAAELDWNQQMELWNRLCGRTEANLPSGPDEGHQEHHDNNLDDPADHANPDRPKRASVVESLSDRNNHGN